MTASSIRLSDLAHVKEDYEYCDLATSPDPYLPGGGAWCNGTLQGVIDRLDYIHGALAAV